MTDVLTRSRILWYNDGTLEMVRTIKTNQRTTPARRGSKAGTINRAAAHSTKETKTMTKQQQTIHQTIVKPLQEEVSWALHKLEALGDEVPPETADAVYSLGHLLTITGMDLGGVAEEECWDGVA